MTENSDQKLLKKCGLCLFFFLLCLTPALAVSIELRDDDGQFESRESVQRGQGLLRTEKVRNIPPLAQLIDYVPIHHLTPIMRGLAANSLGHALADELL